MHRHTSIHNFRVSRFFSNIPRFFGIVFLLGAFPTVQAQVESGKVVGTVKDASGAVVANAAVKVTETQTNVERKTKSDNNGEYVVTELKSGEYTVTVEHSGFKKAMQAAFKLDVNQVVRVDITLAVGSINEEVVVTAAAPLLDSQTSSIGQVVEEKQVHDLPLNGRDFIELSYLTPGVNQGPASGATGQTVQQGNIPENERGNGAVQANGLTATNNNFLLNGFDNNEQQIGFEVIQPSIDAIQEFKVQTNNFGADIGRGGAVVNVVLKSGTNKFHGSVFEFVRNSIFDAKNYFDDPSLPIPPYKQNQFGATFGGPILKDKTFFFLDYQGTRIRQSQTDISFVPPVSERGGNFSDLLTGNSFSPCGSGYAPTDPQFDTGTIFDPFSAPQNYTCANGNAITYRAPFSGNIIPPCVGSSGRSASGGGCLDPAAVNVANLFPAPNFPSQGNAFLLNPVLRNNQDAFDIRVDHQVSTKNNLFGTFSWNNVDAHQPDPLLGDAGGGTFSGDIKDLARAVGVNDIHSFSPNKINEFKVGYTRYVVSATPNFVGQPIAQQLGIPGIYDPSNPVGTGGLPNIMIAGLAPLGNQDYFPEDLRENNYQLSDSFTLVHGSHSFKMGVDLRRRLHGFSQAQNERGDLSFDQQFTEEVNTSTGGDPLASFLLGYPISAFRDDQTGAFGIRWWEVSAYFMDDYRVSQKLTLNLGLRYDLFTPMTEQFNRLANFNFSTGQFISPKQPGVSASGNVDTDYNNFAPRFGFAWTPGNEQTVVRGGFGIFYDLQADQNDAELPYNPGTSLYGSETFNYSASTPGPWSLSTGFPTPAIFATLSNPSGRASAARFNNRTTYIEEWNLDIQHAVLKDLLLDVAYVGTHGVKLAQLENLNQPVLPLDTNFCGPVSGACSNADLNYGRPYFSTVPQIGPIRTLIDDDDSISHGLQVKLEKRFSSNWSTLTAYTWQHTIGQTEENEYYEPQNTHNPAAERGDNGPDFRHQFTSAWSYQLPFGPGQRFFSSSGPVHWLTGGWIANGIVALYSGQAFTPILSFDPTNTGSGAPRPDVIGNPYNFSNATSGGCPSNQQSVNCWFNPAAFAIPAVAPGQTFATNFGDATRGSLRGPAQYNVDFSMFKNFTFSENKNLQLRAEVFNLFNTPEFAPPQNTVDVAAVAGVITSTVHSSRQIQLALKFMF